MYNYRVLLIEKRLVDTLYSSHTKIKVGVIYDVKRKGINK